MSQSVRTIRSGPLQVTVCIDANLLALDRERMDWIGDLVDHLDSLPGADTSDSFPEDAPAEANPGPAPEWIGPEPDMVAPLTRVAVTTWHEDTDPLGEQAMEDAARDNSRALYDEARASVALDGQPQPLGDERHYIGHDEDEAPEDPADVHRPLTDEERAAGWIDGPELAALAEDDPSLLSADLMRVTSSPSTFTVHAVKLPPEPELTPDEALRTHACSCGRTFKSASGLAGHRRWCPTGQRVAEVEAAEPEPDDEAVVARLQALVAPALASPPTPDEALRTTDPSDSAIIEAVTAAWRRPPLLLTIEMRRLFRQAMQCEDSDAVDDLIGGWSNEQGGRFRRAFDIGNEQSIGEWIDGVREAWARTPERAAG